MVESWIESRYRYNIYIAGVGWAMGIILVDSDDMWWFDMIRWIMKLYWIQFYQRSGMHTYISLYIFRGKWMEVEVSLQYCADSVFASLCSIPFDGSNLEDDRREAPGFVPRGSPFVSGGSCWYDWSMLSADAWDGGNLWGSILDLLEPVRNQ